ncbi:MAG: hypothetical protein Q9217_004153 [Psora testacea]
MSSYHTSRPSANYDAFDTITEPGRRPQPMFMRRTKTRRSRIAILGSVLCVILFVWGWRSSGIDITPATSGFSSNSPTTTPQTPISLDPLDPAESPLVATPSNETSTNPQSSRPAFHLLIPASESNPELCKTLLSAFVLGYPAPTLINWGQDTKEGNVFKESASHTAKIRGVYDFLNDKSKVMEEDLVLIIDGYDVWFQLPPQILIRRYHELVEEADQRLKGRYGMISEDQNRDSLAERVPKYSQNVIWGADKICWPNPKEDPACAAVPYSTLPKDVYGPETDKDPEAFLNRPRYLNSGNVIGSVKHVRDVYELAAHKVEDKGEGGLGDQFVFAEIFGEQEFQRETLRRASQGTGGRWLDWLSDTLGTSESPLSANITINNMTTIPGQRYEYGLGLDYESRLFQTMTHSVDDIGFIAYNASTDLLSTHHSLPLFLPQDLQTAESPFSYASPGNHSIESDPEHKTLLLPYSPNLDNLPDQNVGGIDVSWRDLPLATNTHSAAIPALLHVNGDKSLLTSWWPRIWYHPYARALLRRFIRSTQSPEAATAAANGGQTWWDQRGGRGGVWTDQGTWMGWGEVCKGVEDAVFGDGKGVWAKEEGDGKVRNSFGKVLVGEDDDE